VTSPPGPRPNTRVERTRSSPSALRSPLTRCPLGRGSYRSARHLAVACWLGLAGIACTAVAHLKEPPTWRIDLWSTQGQYLGAVVVELTGHRAHGAPDSPAQWVEIGRVLEKPPGVPGIGREVEVTIDGRQFSMNLNRGTADDNLVVAGAMSGSAARGEARLQGVVGLNLGRFKTRRG
jgi:hypothetical protein